MLAEKKKNFPHLFDTTSGPNGSLKGSLIETPLGEMIAIADERFLYLLEFVDRRALKREMERLRTKTKQTVMTGSTPPLLSIEKELKHYFSKGLHRFTTPMHDLGSPFQKRVWEELQKIPFGTTCSYADIASKIGQPTAYRAVARANGSNQLAIIIPCHRVINADGQLSGYGGGVDRKQWLLEHEKKCS